MLRSVGCRENAKVPAIPIPRYPVALELLVAHRSVGDELRLPADKTLTAERDVASRDGIRPIGGERRNGELARPCHLRPFIERLHTELRMYTALIDGEPLHHGVPTIPGNNGSATTERRAPAVGERRARGDANARHREISASRSRRIITR